MMVVTDEMIAQAANAKKDLKMEMAVALYASQVFDLRMAAEYAGVFPWMKLAAEIKKRGIETWDALTPDDLEEEIITINKYFQNH